MTLDETVDQLLLDCQDGHSSFQIAHFIVGAEGPTIWGMYQQALRELRKRRDILADIDLELELARHARHCWSTVGRLLGWLWTPLRIRATRTTRRYANLLTARDSTYREFAEFLDHAKKLNAQLGDVDRSTLEAQQWRARGLAMAAGDLHFNGALSTRAIEFLMGLPVGMREEIAEELRGVQKKRLGFGAMLEIRGNALPSESPP